MNDAGRNCSAVDGGIVKRERSLRSLRSERDVAQVHPGVDVSLVESNQPLQDAGRLAVVTGPEQVRVLGNRVAVPVFGVGPRDDLLNIEFTPRFLCAFAYWVWSWSAQRIRDEQGEREDGKEEGTFPVGSASSG